MVSGSDNGHIQLWDVPTGQLLASLETGDSGNITSVTYSLDGTMIACCCGHIVYLWDVSSGNETDARCYLGDRSAVFSAAFSPDTTTLVAGDEAGNLLFWGIKSASTPRILSAHQNRINSVGFSPDGLTVVTGSDDSLICLWDLATRNKIETYEGHTSKVTCVAFAPDGKSIVSGSEDKTVRLWDTATGTELFKFEGHDDGVKSVAISPDGRRVVSGSDDASIRLWDVATGLPYLDPIAGHGGSVNSVAFSPFDQRIVSGSDDASIRLWDVVSGKLTKVFGDHSACVRSIAISPDSGSIASGSDDATVRLWDLATGAELTQFLGHTAGVNAVKFSPDGTNLISGSDDNTLRLWDVNSGKRILIFKGHKHDVLSVDFSHDGSHIASSSRDKTVRVWDSASGEQVMHFSGHMDTVNSAAFSPDGTMIVSASDDNSIWLWDVAKQKEIRQITGHENSVESVAFSPDGTKVVSGSGDESIRIWDVQSGRQIIAFNGHDGDVFSVVFHPDGSKIVSGGEDDTVRLWDVASGKEILKLVGHSASVLSVAFAADKHTIVSGAYDAGIMLWDLLSAGTEATMRLKGHSELVSSVAFSRNGSRIASGSHDTTIRIWDVISGTELLKIPNRGASVHAVAFSPDGAKVACGSDDEYIRVWDASSGELSTEINGHTGAVLSVAFSPDGHEVVSCSDDKSISLWRLNDGKEVFSMHGHPSSVHSVAFSHNGPNLKIVSGSDDNSIRIWNARTGVELSRLIGHKKRVNTVAFSPDDTKIVSGSFDKSVRVWSVASGEKLLKLDGHAKIVLFATFSPDGSKIISASQDKCLRLWDVASGQELACVFRKDQGASQSVSFSPVHPFIACSSAKHVALIRYDDFFGSIEHAPTHFVPTWYLNSLIEQGNGKLLQALVKSNPASFHWSEMSDSKVFSKLCTAEYTSLRRVKFWFRPFVRLDTAIEAVLGSESRHKPEMLHQVLSQYKRCVTEQKLLPEAILPSDDVALQLRNALKQPGLTPTVLYFFQSTALLETTLTNPVSVHFIEDDPLITKGSLLPDEVDLWSREAHSLLTTGDTDYSVGLVIPFADMASSTLLRKVAKFDDHKWFDTLTFRALIDFKWQAYGRRKFTVRFILYLLGLAFLMAFSVLVSGYSDIPIDKRLQFSSHTNTAGVTFSPARNAATLLTAMGVIAWLAYSIIQESVQLVLSGFFGYWGSIWNYLDVANILITISLLITFALGLDVTDLLLAIAVYFRWLGIIYYLQPYSSTGPLVRMITAIIRGVRYLILVLAISVFAVTNSLYILLRFDPASTSFGDAAHSLFTMYFGMILNQAPADFVEGPYKIYIRILYVWSSLFTTILLLNLMIASMNNSYSAIKESEIPQLYMLRADIILELEQFFRDVDFRNVKYFPKYIHVLVPRGANRPVLSEKSASAKVDDVKQQLDVVKAQVTRQVGALNDLVERRIDRVASELHSIKQLIAKVSNQKLENRYSTGVSPATPSFAASRTVSFGGTVDEWSFADE